MDGMGGWVSGTRVVGVINDEIGIDVPYHTIMSVVIHLIS
jgi:hypothetical protein